MDGSLRVGKGVMLDWTCNPKSTSDSHEEDEGNTHAHTLFRNKSPILSFCGTILTAKGYVVPSVEFSQLQCLQAGGPSSLL